MDHPTVGARVTGLKLHPRVLTVQKAGNDLERAFLAISERDSLTYAESVGILAQVVQNCTKYAIREERHPEDPSRPGGLE